MCLDQKQLDNKFERNRLELLEIFNESLNKHSEHVRRERGKVYDKIDGIKGNCGNHLTNFKLMEQNLNNFIERFEDHSKMIEKRLEDSTDTMKEWMEKMEKNKANKWVEIAMKRLNWTIIIIVLTAVVGLVIVKN